MSEYLQKIKDFFRINFIGKPYELNKLIFNNSTIIENQKEADTVIKACQLFKGWQNLGQMTTFSFLLFSSYLNKQMNLQRKTQFKLILCSFIPIFGFYFYSHFTYWQIIREIVLITREREKRFSHLDKNQIEEYKIVYNLSKDYHKYIQDNINYLDSIKRVFKKIN